jgi:hypothetical protein
MTPNVDKSLYQAPLGLDALVAQDAPAIEIEVLNPEAVTIGVDGMEIELTPEAPPAPAFDGNLAEHMEEGDLTALASQLLTDANNDKNARKDWEDTYREGLTLLGLKNEERTEPWSGACGVVHPMITEAVVRFQSEAITETFPPQGPVRTKIVGKETPEKKQAANRVEEDLNFQLTERMTEFRPEHERLLWSLPAAGSAFKKVYFDPSLNRQTSVFVAADDIYLPYGTTELSTCYRLTHRMRKTKNELLKLQLAGFYRDVELGDPPKTLDTLQQAKDKTTGFEAIDDDRYELYEMHVDIDLKGFEDVGADGEPTGVALPYVVTLLCGSNTVLSVRRNWMEEDPLRLKRMHFVHYQYIPGFGAYGFGLFHLIGGYAKSATSLMRQLVDAGTLSNLPGGLKTKGLRVKGDNTPISPGEFRDVDVGSGTIRDNIMPLPYKEPSATLYQLLGNIVEEGRRFAATADVKVADMSAQAPVGTTLAILERSLKIMTAVQARVHYALKQELQLIAGIIRDFAPDEYAYEPDTGPATARQGDFAMVDIIPVSDPNAATMSQRVVQYQAALQLAQMAPQIYDLPQLHRQMLEVLGIKNAAKLVPLDEDNKPKDPVSENMALLKGSPVKAFMYQDHDAHIAAHTAFMQDPMIAAQMGQNPMAQQMQASAMAHIAEHLGFSYRRQIEARIGVALPPPDEPMPEDMEVEMSRMVAAAGQQITQQHMAQAQQQKNQQMAQDPLIQLQQQELQIKQQELQRKIRKDSTDAALKAQELQIDAQKEGVRMQSQERQNDKRLQVDMAKTSIQAQRAAQQRKPQ